MKKLSLLLFLIVALAACNKKEEAPAFDESRMVSFQGRNIDLKPYFEGYPYSTFTPFYKAGKLYYYQEGATTQLKEIALGKTDLENGKVISDIDFAKRNVWTIKYNDIDKNLYWMGDEKNDEIINLYRLNPETQKVEKLTDVPYIFGYKFNKDKSQIAYVPRLGQIEDRQGELRILDLATKSEKIIAKDSPQMRFTWCNPSWQPNGKGIVTAAFRDADRTYGNLVYVDIATGKVTTLTNPAKARSYPVVALSEWLDDNTFVYTSNEDGYYNLYKYDLKLSQATQLTNLKQEIAAAEMITVDGQQYVFAISENPVTNKLYLVDAKNGQIVLQQEFEEQFELLDIQDNKVMLSSTSAINKFRIDEITVSSKGFNSKPVLDLPKELKDKIVNCEVEKIEYPTFDIDSATGKPRMLHAYLYKPKNPLPKDKQIVMIQSFYGGENRYNVREHILAEAGIYVLSPAPRGSSGFGREFAALNDKDLGGNEIIDVIYAAKYVSEKLGIPSSRVGAFGGSHGGYATMRLLTFPGEINGNKAQFDWGFGIAHAGFSDIIHFYRHCNIPDWVTLEAGNPETEAAKLNDRSPLYHANLMKGKLMLTHGTNDNRVPIEGSKFMADSLKKYNKDVRFEEFKEMGHHIKGLDGNIRLYKTWFDFLSGIK